MIRLISVHAVSRYGCCKKNPESELLGKLPPSPQLCRQLLILSPKCCFLICTWWRNEISHPLSSKSELGSVSHALAMSFANDEEAKALAESYGVALLDKMNLFTEQVSSVTRTRRPHTVRDATPTQSPM